MSFKPSCIDKHCQHTQSYLPTREREYTDLRLVGQQEGFARLPVSYIAYWIKS